MAKSASVRGCTMVCVSQARSHARSGARGPGRTRRRRRLREAERVHVHRQQVRAARDSVSEDCPLRCPCAQTSAQRGATSTEPAGSLAGTHIAATLKDEMTPRAVRWPPDVRRRLEKAPLRARRVADPGPPVRGRASGSERDGGAPATGHRLEQACGASAPRRHATLAARDRVGRSEQPARAHDLAVGHAAPRTPAAGRRAWRWSPATGARRGSSWAGCRRRTRCGSANRGAWCSCAPAWPRGRSCRFSTSVSVNGVSTPTCR